MLTAGLCEKVQSPVAFVVAVPAFAKLSTGNGSCSMVTVRPLLFRPFSFPDKVVAPPNFTVVELAAIVMFFGSGF